MHMHKEIWIFCLANSVQKSLFNPTGDMVILVRQKDKQIWRQVSKWVTSWWQQNAMIVSKLSLEFSIKPSSKDSSSSLSTPPQPASTSLSFFFKHISNSSLQGHPLAKLMSFLGTRRLHFFFSNVFPIKATNKCSFLIGWHIKNIFV